MTYEHDHDYDYNSFEEGERYRIPSQRDDQYLEFKRIEWKAGGRTWTAVFKESKSGAKLKVGKSEINSIGLEPVEGR